MTIDNTFIRKHSGMVKAIANRVKEHLPVNVELDDLISAGCCGLLMAEEKYEPSMGVPFDQFAKFRVKGAMIDFLRINHDPLTRTQRAFQKQHERATLKLAKELGRNPTEDELAAELGISVDDLHNRLISVSLCSLSSIPTSSNGDAITGQVPDTKTVSPHVQVQRTQESSILWEAISQLRPRWQRVLHLYYLEELTMREIGAIMGINESRVSQIKKEALEELGIMLRMKGIRPDRVPARCRLRSLGVGA